MYVFHEYGHILAKSIRSLENYYSEDMWLIEGFVEFINSEFNIFVKLVYMEQYVVVKESNESDIFIGPSDYECMKLFERYQKSERIQEFIFCIIVKLLDI